jgi:LacI family transcriptional regulator
MPNNGNKVTILDIAEKADVSPSTVSRVLRNSAGVAKDKRDAVMQAVSELDYRPNIFAQSLASGQSMTIGVLTQNFGSPFYDGILQGILQGFDDTGYWPLFADGQWQAKIEQEILNLFIARRVDGIIILGGRISEELIQKFSASLPLIVAARRIKGIENQCVYMDNYQAAYLMVQYLLEMGHRDIAFITAEVEYDETVDDIHQRHMAYRKALEDAGIEPDPRLVVSGNLQQQSGVLAVEMLLARGRPFTAIFSANDQMAFGARLALYRRGIRVPDDVSLVGFDDEASAAYMVPPLTTVRQPAVAMGKEAARAILAMVNDKPPVLKVHQAELTIRESVAGQR